MNLLQEVISGKVLTRLEATEVMDGIVTSEFSTDLVGQFLLALRSRGESVEEVIGFCESLRKHARPIAINTKNPLIDTCGTGGDGGQTFNISTAVALVVASSSKLTVAKHGNRSVSSLCGSADVYEALGMKIESDPKKIAHQMEKLNFGFLYAPHFHPAMAVVAPIRKSLGVRTVFNLLGPLINPARVKRQVVGIYDRKLLQKMASVLKDLGLEEALVVHSRDGLDEISLSDQTDAVHLKDGSTKDLVLSPEDVGLRKCDLSELKGGTAKENALIIQNISEGKKGAPRDVVVLNAGAALWIGGAAPDFKSGVKLAEKIIDEGKVKTLLENLRSL